LSSYFDNLKRILVEFARDTHTNKGMIINTGIDNDDSLSLISERITFRTNEKKQMENFKSLFLKLNTTKLDVRCENVKKFSQLLVDHVGYNNEGYYILTTDEKINEAKKFGSESVKCIGCGYHHRNSCSSIQKIVGDLFVDSLQILFRTKVVDKCLLFPEFTSLCGYFTQFHNHKNKRLRDKVITIYLVSRIGNIVSSCIKLENRGDDQYEHKQNMLKKIDYRSFVRTFLFSQLLCVIKAKPSVVSKYVFFAELEYTCLTVCDARSPDTVCDTFLEGYEPLFFSLSGLFDNIKFTNHCSNATLDINLSVEHLNGKYILKEILRNYSHRMEKTLKRNVKCLYEYIEQYLSVSYSGRRDEILQKIEDLDYYNLELMAQEVCDLYKCVRGHLEELIR